MCGITAFSGKEEALPFLLQGLSRLEYRGYDSAGVTLVDKDKLFTVKTKGRLQNLIERLDQAKPKGMCWNRAYSLGNSWNPIQS